MPTIESIDMTSSSSAGSFTSLSSNSARSRRQPRVADLQDGLFNVATADPRGPAKLRILTALALPKLVPSIHTAAACQPYFEDALFQVGPDDMSRLSSRDRARVHLSSDKNFEMFVGAILEPALTRNPSVGLLDIAEQAVKALGPVQEFLKVASEPWDFDAMSRLSAGHGTLVASFTHWLDAISQHAEAEKKQIRLRQGELLSAAPEPQDLLLHIDTLAVAGKNSIERLRTLDLVAKNISSLGSSRWLAGDLAPIVISTREAVQHAIQSEQNMFVDLEDKQNALVNSLTQWWNVQFRINP